MHTKKTYVVKLFSLLLFVLLLIVAGTISANAVTTDGSGTASSSPSTSSQAPIGSVKVYVKKDNANWNDFGTRVFLRSTTTTSRYYELQKYSSTTNYAVSRKAIVPDTYNIIVTQDGKASAFDDDIGDFDYAHTSGVKITVTTAGGSATLNYYTVRMTSPIKVSHGLVTSSNKLSFWTSNMSTTNTIIKGTSISQIYANTMPTGYKLTKITYSKASSESSSPAYTSTSSSWAYKFPDIATPVTIAFHIDPIAYTATFNANGGTWSDSTTANKSKTYNITGTLAVPATVSRIGYTFKGWKITTAAGNWTANTNYNNNPQTKLAGVSGLYGNVTFTAQWAVNSYNISYVLDGGTLPSETIYMNSSGTIYNRNPTAEKYRGSADSGYSSYFYVDHPTRAGYKFLGWAITGMDSSTHTYWYDSKANTSATTSFSYTSNAGKSAYLFKNLRATSGTVTFTAHWELISYTATFAPNGGTWSDSTTANKSKIYNVTGTLAVPANISKTGYTFRGWKVTTSAGNWAANTVYNNSTQTKLTGSTGKYGTVTFTAQWQKNAPVVNVYADGSLSHSLPKKVVIKLESDTSKSYTLSKVPNLSENSLSTTATIPNGTYLVYARKLSSSTELVYTGKKVIFNNNIPTVSIYYYTINLKNDYGIKSVSASESWVLHGQQVNISAEILDSTRFKFAGWVNLKDFNVQNLPISTSIEVRSPIKYAAKTIDRLEKKTATYLISPFAKYPWATILGHFGDQSGAGAGMHRAVDMSASESYMEVSNDVEYFSTKIEKEYKYSTLGKEIVASANGTVVDVGWSGYGNYVIVKYDIPEAYRTIYTQEYVYVLYGHMMNEQNPDSNSQTPTQLTIVKKGEHVIRGQLLGHAGETYGPYGAAFGPHLHFEVRLTNNKYKDQNRFLDPEKVVNFTMNCRSTLK